MCPHSKSSPYVPSACWWGRKDGKERGLWIALPSPFLVFSCFLEDISFFLCSKQVLVWMEDVACRGCQLPCHLVVGIMHLLVLTLSFAELPYRVCPLEFCAHRNCKCYMQMERQRMVAKHYAHVCSAHMHTPVSHWASPAKHKHKIIKNFKLRIFPKRKCRWPRGTWKDAQHC